MNAKNGFEKFCTLIFYHEKNLYLVCVLYRYTFGNVNKRAQKAAVERSSRVVALKMWENVHAGTQYL